MKMRSMARMVGAIALVAALTLGSTMASAPPAAADPADVFLPKNTMSPQFHLGACRYKVMWGNYVTPYARLHVYNPTACGGTGGMLVAVHYTTGGSTQVVNSTTVEGTGSDGCGTYSIIQANATSGTATRALVWVSTGARFYDDDGTAGQTYTAC